MKVGEPEREERRRASGALRRWLGLRSAALAVGVVAAFAGAFVVGHVVGARNGAPAPERLQGGPRSETIFGTQHDDVIDGRGGADKLVGRNGSDLISGGKGRDLLRGGRDDDRLLGGRGGATMIGGRGEDQFNMVDGERVGGRGRDVIRARDETPDQINCGPGLHDVAFVDGDEEGVYDCESVVGPAGGGS